MSRFALLLLIACHPPAPVGAKDSPVPADSAAQCTQHCTSIGLSLDSVVIMANNVGCVCRAPAAAPGPGAPGAAAAGMATIMIQQIAAAQAAANAPKPK